MNSGKISFSPDYKSEKPMTQQPCPACGKVECFDHQLRTRVDHVMSVKAERVRLEREVIETAKHMRRVDLAMGGYWKKRELDPAYDPDSAALFTLVNESGGLAHNKAVDALLAFESEQEGNK